MKFQRILCIFAMEIAVRQFFVGQLVLAKIKGYPPWPGLITEIDRSRAKVVYFNWHNQYNWIGFKKITLASSAANIIEQHYDRNIAFAGAVNEMRQIANSILDKRIESRRNLEAIQRNETQVHPDKNQRQMVFKKNYTETFSGTHMFLFIIFH